MPHSCPRAAVAQYRVLLNVSGFFAVALLSGSLAESVRSAGLRLEQASTEIADLQALNEHVIDSLPSGLITTDPLAARAHLQPAPPRRLPVSLRLPWSAARWPTCCS